MNEEKYLTETGCDPPNLTHSLFARLEKFAPSEPASVQGFLLISGSRSPGPGGLDDSGCCLIRGLVGLPENSGCPHFRGLSIPGLEGKQEGAWMTQGWSRKLRHGDFTVNLLTRCVERAPTSDPGNCGVECWLPAAVRPAPLQLPEQAAVPVVSKAGWQ